MTKCEIILEKVGMSELLEKYNIQIERNKILCPFHDDNNPSATIDKNNKWFHCFACGANYNVIDFVCNYEKCKRKDAINIISSIFGLGLEFTLSEYDFREIERLQRTRELEKQREKRRKLYMRYILDSIYSEIEVLEIVKDYSHLTRGEYRRDEWENEDLFFYAIKRIDRLNWFYSTLNGEPTDHELNYFYPTKPIELLRCLYNGEITI